MSATSTSQLQYTGFDALTAGLATALMTVQPSYATTLVHFDQPPLPAQRAIKAEGRPWITAYFKRIEALPTNWDGFGADPIDPSVIRLMKTNLEQLLPLTSLPGSIVPGADGSLQGEWHLERASFGLLIENDGKMSCWVRPSNMPEIERFGFEARELFQSAVLTYLT